MKILFFTPPGVGKSPEHLMGEELHKRGHIVDIQHSNRLITQGDYDVVVGAMEVSCAVALHSAQHLGIPCYLHAEWIPPWRVGLESPLAWGYDTALIPQEKPTAFYHEIIRCLTKADKKSMAGQTFIRDAERFSGQSLEGCLVRYPSAPFPTTDLGVPKQDYIVTLARLVPSKKLMFTAQALALLNLPITWKVIGSGPDMLRIQHTLCTSRTKVEFLGALPTEGMAKFEVLGAARFAVQNWSGIPPAEAAFAGTATVSMNHPYMLELYDDTLIWSQNNHIEDHARAILEAWQHPGLCEQKASYLRERLYNHQLPVTSITQGAKIWEKILQDTILPP